MFFRRKKLLASMAARLEKAERREKAAMAVYGAHRRKIERLERWYADSQGKLIDLRRVARAQGVKLP
jgi:hypothetical protein